MQSTLPHIHSSECLGANELDEICCREIGNEEERLKDADRWVVTLGNAETVNVFTDTKEDAYALAEAHTGRKAIWAEKRPQVWP